VGLWYSVNVHEGETSITSRPDLTAAWGRAEPRVLAFDIECTKEPLKFPNAEFDSIYMISYMIDGEGFLIVNREIVTADIEDFEYTPKKEYEGPFSCFNEVNELAVLRRFLDHIKEVKPAVFVTYNGDFFDFPFIDTRMKKYGLDMEAEIGIQKQTTEEYGGRFACHLDAFHWVNRDSYLPQGSRGLKAVTKYKLGYDPKEIHHEDMLPFAKERPQVMAPHKNCRGCPEHQADSNIYISFVLELTASVICAGNGVVLRFRCSGNLLPLHAIRASFHFFALQHHPHDTWRRVAKGFGYFVRDPSASASISWHYRLS
jgi:DNA polymerase epsilon subunit 1